MEKVNIISDETWQLKKYTTIAVFESCDKIRERNGVLQTITGYLPE